MPPVENNKREGLLPRYSFQDRYKTTNPAVYDILSKMDKSWEWLVDWYDNEETVRRMKETGYSEAYINNILNKVAPNIEFGTWDIGPSSSRPDAQTVGLQELPDIPLTKQEIEEGKKELPYRPSLFGHGGTDIYFEKWFDTIPEHEMEHYLNFGAGIGGIGMEERMVPSKFGSTRKTFYNPSKEDYLIYNAIPEENRFINNDELRNTLNESFDIKAKKPVSKLDFKKKYIGSPTEIRARLMEIRRTLGVSPGEEITIDMLNNMKQPNKEKWTGDRNPLQELEGIMPKKNILFLLNTLAARLDDSEQEGLFV